MKYKISKNPRPPVHVAQYQDIAFPDSLTGQMNLVTDPKSVAASDKAPFLLILPGHYDYQPVIATSFVWHVNFGHPKVFEFYNSPLFAQDEIMTLEFPGLGAVRVYINGEMKNPIPKIKETVYDKKETVGEWKPTPITVAGVERLLIAKSSEKGALYGTAFNAAKPKERLEAVKLFKIASPIIANIIAMASEQPPKSEVAYTEAQILYELHATYAGFMAGKLEAQRITGTPNVRVEVHSGNLGCGAFGNNILLMGLVQIISARVAVVDFVLHVGTSQDKYAKVLAELKDVWPLDNAGPISKTDLVKKVEALDIMTGVGDRN